MIGSTVGNYRIVERLGDGGMGSVYRAVDEMLDREVAIKVLRPELARQGALVERFRQEARALARLSHPRIATLHGLERHGDDLLMIMEYVRGDTLETIVQRSGRVAWQRAAELCIAVLDALDHAHDNQIVHRDIKPANVMLAHSGAVKVMDFGIARMLGKSRQTQFGHAVGTPTYMAPEQLRGEEVDRRTDVYAVGAVLFELITGRLPFEADSDYRLMMMQLHDPPPRPSSMLPDVPAGLDEVVTRAMAKDRNDRFPDAVSFSRALRGLLDAGADTRTRTPAPETRLAAPAYGAMSAPGETADYGTAEDSPLVGAVGSTRVADAGGVPETRLPYAQPHDASGYPAATEQGSGGYGGAADYHGGARGTVQRVLAYMEPWQKDWRTWSAVGAVLLAAGFGALSLRSPGNSAADSETIRAGQDTVAALTSSTPDVQETSGTSTPGGGTTFEPAVEEASSLIINPPASRQPVAPQPQPEQPKVTPPSRSGESPGGNGRRSEPEPRERPREKVSTTPEPPPRPEPREEPPRPAGQSEAEARSEILGLLSQAAGQLSGRDAGAAVSMIGGAKGDEWAALMREGRISMSISGSPGVELNGDRATADVSASVNVRSAFGANRNRAARFTANLERRGGRWVLQSLRPVGDLSLK